MVLTSHCIVTPEGPVDGWLSVKGGVIDGLGPGRPPAVSSNDEVLHLSGRLLPGFIDLHVHGAGGASFDDGAAQIHDAVAVHRSHGTTGTLVSLVTAPLSDLRIAIAAAGAAAAADPRILGLHLEGPFLSPDRAGVHEPTALIHPTPAAVDQLLEAGEGRIRAVTVAPELPGGAAAVRQLVVARVHAAIGHSDAGYDVARAAFDDGADLVTHAFNAMRPLHHRDPAIVGAAADAGDVVLEVINDGVHLHPGTVRLLQTLAPDRIALITDAMAAAGGSDGCYHLGRAEVSVEAGVARLTSGPAVGAIAGSTLTMDAALRHAVCEVGVDLTAAAAAASTVPARLLGLDGSIGALAVGLRADVVVMDDDLAIEAVLLDGAWADDRRPRTRQD
ncbi:N-acetylglucosamine-6-phosphate deacetylase [Nakamurella sp. YIM 132087]|uniref:N-acetylglucosamine-6-phosphate deacetylase n=1 Tax=Nakamurella alba TaxID=2665158 RepID=A0A7K1FLY3_9ACTN|nr:N-acetylglucosamine-6-phosphate deacetylase [Nakamurella alba]